MMSLQTADLAYTLDKFLLAYSASDSNSWKNETRLSDKFTLSRNGWIFRGSTCVVDFCSSMCGERIVVIGWAVKALHSEPLRRGDRAAQARRMNEIEVILNSGTPHSSTSQKFTMLCFLPNIPFPLISLPTRSTPLPVLITPPSPPI